MSEVDPPGSQSSLSSFNRSFTSVSSSEISNFMADAISPNLVEFCLKRVGVVDLLKDPVSLTFNKVTEFRAPRLKRALTISE